MSKHSIHKCLNCDSRFEFDFKFCPSCGQKNTDGKITFAELWSEFQNTYFNIDSRSWRTLINIFIPGKLTLEYFEGKHRQYVHPLRLLIVTSLLLIVAMSYQDFQSSTNHTYIVKDRIFENYERQRLYNILDNIIDSTNVILPEQNTKIVTDTIISGFRDSLNNLLHKYGDRYGEYINLNHYIPFENESSELISKHDFLTKSEDQLVEKYKKNAGRWDQLMFRQKIKYIKDESKLTAAMINRISWAILLMMPFIALVLYFLNIKRGFYFIENLIFTFHIHSFSFIVLTLLILGMNILPVWLAVLSLITIQVFVFLSMLRVYGQNIATTLFKHLILNIFYFVLFIVFLIGTYLVSFLLL